VGATGKIQMESTAATIRLVRRIKALRCDPPSMPTPDPGTKTRISNRSR
jgi:hypothetical protein